MDDSIKQEVSDIKSAVARIERAVLGEPSIGHIGLVDTVVANRVQISKVENAAIENFAHVNRKIVRLDTKIIKFSSAVVGAGAAFEITKWLLSLKGSS